MNVLADPLTTLGPAVALGFAETTEPKGPTVALLIRAKTPAVVVQISPLTGDVGAVPGGMLKPE